jgi:hypothetical protein
MSAVKTDEGTTIDKAGRTGTVTDEESTELVFGSFLKDSDAVWVAGNDVLTIFGEVLIGGIVGTIIHLVCSFFGVESFGIGNFDTKLTLDIFKNIYRAIKRLFFEFICDLFSDKGSASLCMILVIDAETRVLGFIRFDTRERILGPMRHEDAKGMLLPCR